MKYDPIKDILNKLIKKCFFLRIIFFKLLDVFILRQWYVKKEIKKYLRDSQTSLFIDAGAGFCQYSYSILKNYPNLKILAIDLKTDYLKDFHHNLTEAYKKRLSYISADLQLYTSKEKAEMLIAIDILEHIPDDISVIKNFRNSLLKDGILIISVPSNFDEAAAFTDEHYRPGYSVSDLKSKVINNGFEIISLKYSYGMFGKLAWKLIMKNSISLLSISKLLFLILPFYLLIILVPSLILMYIDFLSNNKKGNGLILVAKAV